MASKRRLTVTNLSSTVDKLKDEIETLKVSGAELIDPKKLKFVSKDHSKLEEIKNGLKDIISSLDKVEADSDDVLKVNETIEGMRSVFSFNDDQIISILEKQGYGAGTKEEKPAIKKTEKVASVSKKSSEADIPSNNLFG